MADSRRASRVPIGFALAVCALGLAGCESLFKSRGQDPPAVTVAPPALPGKAGAHRVSQFVFYSDTALKPSAPLFDELSRLRDQIFRDLALPPSDTIVQVYLFDDQEKYERYMRFRYPELPKRRAFFVAHPGTPGRPRELLVFTFWGDHLRQDLRHELTHALVNSVIKDVPLWLDEGLAEYYELPPERDGVNLLHVDALRRGEAVPDLAALERLDQVQQMGRAQYQEAWAWVHLMLRGSPQGRAVLLGYLHQLRDPAPPGPLLPRLREVYPAPTVALAKHLSALDAPAATIRPVVDRR
jgi:hypothetical protein